MKKIFSVLVLIIVLVFLLVGCSEGSSPSNVNPQNLYGIVELPNREIVEGKVEHYTRYNASNIEITIGDNAYFVHPAKATLIRGNYPTEKGSIEK